MCEVKEIIKEQDNINYYVKIDFHNKERLICVTPQVEIFLKQKLHKGDKIEVWRNYRADKEFYLIRKVYANG